MAGAPRKIGIWVLTPNGLALAARLRLQWPETVVHCSRRLTQEGRALAASPFDGLAVAVAAHFRDFEGHIFIMAAGIVVRTVAPLLRHKMADPAVVVVDDLGRFAISLLAGHVGGANCLARRVAELLGAIPVITTASDVNARPAMDMLAVELGLRIENPSAIKGVNMALLAGRSVALWDPLALVAPAVGDACHGVDLRTLSALPPDHEGVCVDDGCTALPDHVLRLRPPSLTVGIGCNRGASEAEIAALLTASLAEGGLSGLSLGCIASIDLKRDEPGLQALAWKLGVPTRFFSAEALNQVCHVPNPSAMAAKHTGAHSVCEAAAILAADQGRLIVPKRKSANVTLAIARQVCISSASARGTISTSPAAPLRC